MQAYRFIFILLCSASLLQYGQTDSYLYDLGVLLKQVNYTVILNNMLCSFLKAFLVSEIHVA